MTFPLTRQALLEDSKRVEQAAVTAAQEGYRRVADAAPALRVEALRAMRIKTTTAADMAIAETTVAPILAEAARVRDQQIGEAKEQAADRICCAALHFGDKPERNDPGNPRASHAVAWLRELLSR